MMRRHVVIGVSGGKGGSGKSTVAVNLAISLTRYANRVLLVDSDVESPVDHILLGLERMKIGDIEAFRPRIIEEKCIKCSRCVDNCPEHALVGLPGQLPVLMGELCSGCKVCFYVCPMKVIIEDRVSIGSLYEMVHENLKVIQGELNPGFRQYVNVTVDTIDVAMKLRDEFDYIVIDTAPGTGASIYAALSPADLVLAVTEPTPLGANDLSMLLGLMRKMEKKTYIVLNKADMPGGKKDLIYDVAERYNTSVIFEIPYSEQIMQVYFRGHMVKTGDDGVRKIFDDLARKVLDFL